MECGGTAPLIIVATWEDTYLLDVLDFLVVMSSSHSISVAISLLSYSELSSWISVSGDSACLHRYSLLLCLSIAMNCSLNFPKGLYQSYHQKLIGDTSMTALLGSIWLNCK